MNTESVIKQIDKILDFYNINQNRDAIKGDIFEVVEQAYFEGWSNGYDAVAEEQSIPYPSDE